MAMIMSVQRLKESGGREEERERGVGQIFADKTAAPLRWLQEQIEAHTFSQSRNRERERLSWEGRREGGKGGLGVCKLSDEGRSRLLILIIWVSA